MYYLSYGSNMNIGQMKWRCPKTNVYGNGKIYGWKLVFNYHADIIETGSDNDFVPVVVWNLKSKKDESRLDTYEGYPNYYTKVLIPVIMDDGKLIKAMAYVMTDERKGIYPPSIKYLACIMEGYIDNNIEITPLYNALQESIETENMTLYNQYNPKRTSESYAETY